MKKQKIIHSLAVAALVLGGVSYSVGVLPTNVGVLTAQAIGTGNVELDLHKLKNYQNGAKDGSDITNTGNVIEGIQNGSNEYLAGVTFTAYDITTYYYAYAAANPTKSSADVLADVKAYYEGLSSASATNIGSSAVINTGASFTSSATGDEHSKPGTLEVPKISNGKNAVYVVFENSTAAGDTDTISEAVPMVVALPISDLETADTIHLYPKNSVSEIIKQVSDPNVAIGEKITYTISLDIPNDFGQVVTRNGVQQFKYQNISVTDDPEPGLTFVRWETINYTGGTAVDISSLPVSALGLVINGVTEGIPDPVGYVGGETSTINLNTPAYTGDAAAKATLVENMRALAGNQLIFTVTAKINKDALVGDNEETAGIQNNLINEASYIIGNGSGGDLTYVKGKDDVQVFTYGHKFIKKDALTAKELTGAEFKVYQTSHTDVTTPTPDITGPAVADLGTKYAAANPIKFVLEGGVYHVATDEEIADANVTKTTTIIANPGITLKGLEAGTYAIVETQAPTGYLLNTTPLAFTVALDNTTTLEGITGSAIDRIDNAPENTLPLTGGQGMKIVITVGVLALSAAVGVYFISRKRNEDSKPSV